MPFDITQTTTLSLPGSPAEEVPVYFGGPYSSSMDAAWDLIKENKLPLWGSVLVKNQTAGRGRMGRVWQSPPGHVYAALRLPPAPPFDGPGASPALALLVALALRSLGLEIMIKWPNDLILDGGKVGGLLLESRAIPGQGQHLIAGLGFNLINPPDGQWQRERDPGAPPPSALPFFDGPEKLWLTLAKKLLLLYKEMLLERTLAELTPEIEKILIWRGQSVTVITPASDPPAPAQGLSGRIVGLAPDGSLRLENEAGRYNLWSGTVCLAPKPNSSQRLFTPM